MLFGFIYMLSMNVPFFLVHEELNVLIQATIFTSRCSVGFSLDNCPEIARELYTRGLTTFLIMHTNHKKKIHMKR